MELIDRHGRRLRLSGPATLYSGEFDYQVIGADKEYFGAWDTNGCCEDGAVSQLQAMGLVISSSNCLFERPEFCATVFGWDATSELSFIKRFLGPESKVLDVGCGWGRLIFPLWDAGIDVDGFDASEVLVRHVGARARRNQAVFIAQMHEFAALGRYDVAFAALNTIRYVESHARLRAHLRNIHLSLKRGGIYLVHASFISISEESRDAKWSVMHKDRLLEISWRRAGIDHWRDELFEEIAIRDTTTGKVYREVQKQLIFSLHDFCELAGELGFQPRRFYDEAGEEMERSARSGRYWIELRRE
jgi:2-polyprenyl-3-methyl-5-hydroxy-6-metoxy-1,4-benzoquinol methylase